MESNVIGIFPGLFVEPVAAQWDMPANHYDAGRQISIETSSGLPAFKQQAAGTVSVSTSVVTSYVYQGNVRYANDESRDTDND